MQWDTLWSWALLPSWRDGMFARACLLFLAGSLVACEPDLGVITCPDGTVCAADLTCPTVPGGACMADGCRGKAPGDDCRPVIGGGGSCNAEGVCVPFSCGDGEVQAPEVCDGTAPQTCIELGDDYGRAACAADCSAIVSTCDFIDNRDLGLDVEGVQLAAVQIVGGVVWVAGTSGVLRQAGTTWEQMLDGSWVALRAIDDHDLWAFDETRAAHWDGASWQIEPWPYGRPTATMVSNGQLVVAANGELVRRTDGGTPTLDDDAWASERVYPMPSPLTPITALARFGGEEIVAYRIFVGSPSGAYRLTVLYAGGPGNWRQVPYRSSINTVHSLLGDSLDDYLVSGEYAPLAQDTPQFLTSRVVTGQPLETIPGSGAMVRVGDGVLITPLSASTLVQQNPDRLGTFYRSGIARRVELPGYARLVATEGRRVVMALDKSVVELGGTLYAPAFTVQSASPPVSQVSVAQLAASDTGDVYALDTRGMVWEAKDASTGTPRLLERVRSIAGTIAVWGVGSDFVAVESNKLTRYAPGGPFSESLGSTARAIAGRASDDILVVGAPSDARRFDGTGWTNASVGLTTDLRAVARTTSGYLAVGDGGYIGAYEAGAWTQRPSGVTEDLRLVAAAGDVYAAAGADFVLRCTSTACQRDPLPWQPTSISMTGGDDIVVVGGGKVVHFDGTAWSSVDLAGGVPNQVLMLDNALWFGEGGAAGRVRQLVRMRPWR